MAFKDERQAMSFQKQMEGPLLQLEKLGALDADDADEIRNLVAEGIAEKFGERYRAFPGERKGVQIRRDAIPKPCALKKRFDAHSKSIRENTLPKSVAVARTYGNRGDPNQAQAQEARSRHGNVAPARLTTQQQQAPKESFYRKPAAPELWDPSSQKSSPEKPVLHRETAPADQTPFNQMSKTPTEPRKDLMSDLAPDTAQTWGDDTATTKQNSASTVPVPAETPIAQAGQDAANMPSKTSSALSGNNDPVTTANGDMVAEEKVDISQWAEKVAEDNDDEAAIKTEEHSYDLSQTDFKFSDDLIWLGDL